MEIGRETRKGCEVRTPAVIEGPEFEPITVAEARKHLEAQQYEDSDIDPLDDAQIEGMLAAAREACEDFLGLSLATKTLEIALDTFPDDGEAVDLPFGPVREIQSVSWGNDSDQELDLADFVLDSYRKPNQLRTTATSGWPAVTEYPNVIKVRYLAGYGVDSDGGQELPKVLRQAILVELTNLFENRGDAPLSTAAEALMRPRRVRLGMA
jgi:uncharacterized phiE125 gp8 family phage protein